VRCYWEHVGEPWKELKNGNCKGTQWQPKNPKNSTTPPQTNDHPLNPVVICLLFFFHETQWFFELLELIGTHGSLILKRVCDTLLEKIKCPSNTGLKVEQVVWIAGVCYIVHQTTVEATSWKSLTKHGVGPYCR
jgi:hypothetical protein